MHNGERIIHVITGTDALTGVVADPSANAGKGMVLLEKLQGLPVLTVVDQGNVALDADVGGTGGATRGRALLGNGVRARDGLGVLLEGRFAIRQAFVVFIRNIDGADLGAFTAARAFIQVYETRLLFDAGGKVSVFPFKSQ